METHAVKKLYEIEFGVITDDIEGKRLVKTQAKASLGLIHKQLVVVDPVR
jgi:hypothetical protein